MEQLIGDLIKEGYLKTERIINAFRKVQRKDFLPDNLKADAALNIPLPISHGQTISQPLTVAFMLELLQPKAGERILDVGSGSGWQTALLAELAGPAGTVYAIERIPELFRFGKKNVSTYHYSNVQFICADGTKGYRKAAPFDKIVVAAAAEIGVPDVFINQLKVGGRLVIPVGKYEQSMVVIDKITDTDLKEERHPGFQFVPLVPKEWGE
ncbi:MAG: protein-L-isoaspartate(D-aspartate) O-methyltransferase [Patescibacteria group bacterium]|nr:protein-L-isoaspartate(D-aspartate) O-methyltransferase [Patescibacteria group bacterium]MDD5715241.1 protein-L-isoaspartate(D-aspartate) O-methyltransferase [Patescibacteria group bacterium]